MVGRGRRLFAMRGASSRLALLARCGDLYCATPRLGTGQGAPGAAADDGWEKLICPGRYPQTAAANALAIAADEGVLDARMLHERRRQRAPQRPCLSASKRARGAKAPAGFGVSPRSQIALAAEVICAFDGPCRFAEARGAQRSAVGPPQPSRGSEGRGWPRLSWRRKRQQAAVARCVRMGRCRRARPAPPVGGGDGQGLATREERLSAGAIARAAPAGVCAAPWDGAHSSSRADALRLAC